MPCMGDRVAAQALTSPLAQNERLFLPSDFANESERRKHDLISLGKEEIHWREGQLFNALRALQHIVKALSTLRRRKIKNERQQKQNSRAGDHIQEGIRQRNYHMATYELARQRLITLDATNFTFPPLTEADLYMKSVQQKRQLGDSHRTDGAPWRAQVPMEVEEEDGMDSIVLDAPDFGTSTQMDKKKLASSRPHKRAKDSGKEDSDDRPEGWLWQLGKLSKMSKDELDEWSNECDRVQWFRAEAEMQRWQEQKEQKLAELLWTNRSFLKMEATWTALASESAIAGHRAYARQKAATYQTRAQHLIYMCPALESSALNAGGNITDWLPSQTPPFPAPEFTNFFEMSQDLEMGILPAHGLGFEGEHAVMTSTPCQGKKRGLGLRCRLESETKSGKQHQEYQIKILKQALEAHEYRIVKLVQQCQYALDNVTRLNENIRRRDAEARQHSECALRRGAELEALRERISQMNSERAEARKANEPIARQSAVAQITQQRAPDGQDQRLNIPNNRKQLLPKRRMDARPSKIPYYRRDSEVLTTLGVASASGTGIAPLGKSSRLSNNSSIASSVPAVPSGLTFVRFALPVQSPRPFGRTTGAVVEVRRSVNPSEKENVEVV
ncbi:hypothetical protein B0H14DRAFT_2628674 [Mycena olivaceomarginata]|nr:hypothetical protein B0H14DRAFT_2628674 [Mycena olivaceomarginata]